MDKLMEDYLAELDAAEELDDEEALEVLSLELSQLQKQAPEGVYA